MAKRTKFHPGSGTTAGRQILSSVAAALMLGAATTAKATHPSYACDAVVEAKLAEHGVDKADIRDVTVEHNRSGGRANSTLGYSVWVQLKSCKGAIVIDVSTECWHQQTYAHGACKLP